MWIIDLEAWREHGVEDAGGLEAADDAEALRAADGFASGQVVAWDGTRLRFARRGPAGTHVELLERPPVAEVLGLLPHPEGGWYRQTWRTAPTVRPEGYPGERATATGIYFLLPPGEESMWHVVRSDEVWFWHRGGPLTLLLGGSGERPGVPETVVLGPDVEHGQTPQALVPAGAWQAAKPAGTEAVLVSCVVSPGFDFADFRIE